MSQPFNKLAAMEKNKGPFIDYKKFKRFIKDSQCILILNHLDLSKLVNIYEKLTDT